MRRHFALAVLIGLLPGPLADGVTIAVAQSPQTTAATPAPPPASTFSQEELRALLGPYALYPDDLLAQLLPACAYPIEIVQASRWLEKNKAAVAKGDFNGIDGQSWEPQVKALARFPDVIAKLNEDLDATTDLGDAFVHQPQEVASTIQDLRRQAQKSGALTSTPQQRVRVEDQSGTSYIVIEPAEPGVIYVPTYDPVVVYDTGVSAVGAGLIGFGVGVAVGAIIDDVWDWGRGWVYPPRWPGYPGYRPGAGIDIDRNVNIGNDINIGNGNTRPWRPDADRYRPGQGSKPGLAKPTPGRPGGPGVRPGDGGRQDIGRVDRPAAGDRPGSAGRPGSGERPNVGGGAARPDRPDGARPAAKPGATSAAKPAARPAAAKPGPKPSPRPTAQPAKPSKPAAKPSRPAQSRPSAHPRPAAFNDVRMGSGAAHYAQRGSMSRQSMSRPPVQRGGRGGGGGRGGRR